MSTPVDNEFFFDLGNLDIIFTTGSSSAKLKALGIMPTLPVVIFVFVV